MADSLQLLQNSVSVMRKELQNLRKQVESLKYMMKREIATSNKQLLSSYSHKPASTAAPSVKLPPRPSERPPAVVLALSEMAIGRVRTCFREKNGTPRQPGLCPTASGTIQIEAFTNPSHSLEGLEEYSHAWLLFVFHHNNDQERVKAKVKPPRLCGDKRGVFATRTPHRPCPVGLSLVRVTGVVSNTVHISGVDLVDGTPILDIKPYIPAYDDPTLQLGSIQTSTLAGEDKGRSEMMSSVKVPSWLGSPPVTQLQVEFSDNAEHQLSFFNKPSDTPPRAHSGDSIHTVDTRELQVQDGNSRTDKSSPYSLQTFTSLSHARQAIVDVLQQDPRSIYRRNKCSQERYKFSIDNLNITCQFEQTKVVVIDIQPKTQWTYQVKS